MKKHYSNNKSRAATKSGGVGTVVKVVAVLLAILGIAYVITSLALDKQWNPLKWGKRVEATQPDNGGNSGDNQKEPVDDLVNAGENKGILLKSRRLAASEFEENGIDAQANTAYSVTATVNEDAADKSVIGSISWKNGSSEWANGKNIADYAALNQTVQYGRNFTLTVKQAFGEPIMIKVASCTDSGVYGTAQVDYLKELQSFTAVLNPNYGNDHGRINVGEMTNTIQITPKYGVGTIEGTISNYKTTFTTNSYFRTELKAKLNAGGGTQSYIPVEKIVKTGQSFKIPLLENGLLTGGGNGSGALVIVNNFIVQHGAIDAVGYANGTAGVVRIDYEVTYSYGDEYSVVKTWYDQDKDVTFGDNPTQTFMFFRSDCLTLISSINEINVAPDHIVALPTELNIVSVEPKTNLTV